MPKPRTSSRRKTPKKPTLSLSVKLPSEKVRAKFLIIYELKVCQKDVCYLTEYYKVKKMRIILNGKKVGKNYLGCYLKNRAYFKNEGLNKKIILHELYHHLVASKGLELSLFSEEKEAKKFGNDLIHDS